ncbi:MAG: O-antigen ligase family protein [Vicinamibacteria bacterium]
MAGDALRRSFIVGAYGLAAAGLLLHPTSSREGLRGSRYWLPVVALALASAGWSPSPSTSIMWAIGLLGTTLIGLQLGSSFELDDQLRMIAVVLVGAGVASAAIVVLAPGLGLMQEAAIGAWKGVFSHKNMLGHAMALSGIACAILAPGGGRLPVVGLAWSVALAVASRSLSALVLLLLGLAGLLILGAVRGLSSRGRLALATVVASGVVLSVLAAWHEKDLLLAALGKSGTVGDRLFLWSALWPPLLERSWFGYGYAGFWRVAESEFPAVTGIRWRPEHAHNGFLDLALGLGLAGTLTFGISFLALARRALLFTRSGDPCRAWPALSLAVLVVGNLFESSLVQANRLDWALYVAVAATLARRGRASSPRSATRAG